MQSSPEQNGFDERVDHRSYKTQESELESTQHEGPKITQLRRQGIFTEISLKITKSKIVMRSDKQSKD